MSNSTLHDCGFISIDCVGVNNTSTLVDHFVLSPREREKRDRRDSRRDERGTGKKEEQKKEEQE